MSSENHEFHCLHPFLTYVVNQLIIQSPNNNTRNANIRGPAIEESRVVNQGDQLNMFSYQDTVLRRCSSLSLSHCLTKARLSLIMPEWLA